MSKVNMLNYNYLCKIKTQMSIIKYVRVLKSKMKYSY